ncbi:MAG: hypothetical protein QOF12_1748 [Solirubrobacteraceae bacterium]|nr:hypothetical protein [Solirubrobacteraceae bacterium]
MFWLVFDKSANPVVLVDESRRFVDVNEAVLALLGQTRGGIIGRVTSDLMRVEERTDAIKRWAVLVKRGEDSGRQTFVRPDGKEVEAHFAGRMTTIEGRRLAVFVVDVIVPQTTPPAEPAVADVTPRERDVIGLIARGANTQAISAELSISGETVRTHVRNAMRRLGVHTRAQLVAITLALDANASSPAR